MTDDADSLYTEDRDTSVFLIVIISYDLLERAIANASP
jgi:hypothetical protein